MNCWFSVATLEFKHANYVVTISKRVRGGEEKKRRKKNLFCFSPTVTCRVFFPIFFSVVEDLLWGVNKGDERLASMG